MENQRSNQRRQFLRQCNLDNARIEAMAQDASFRRYFRIFDDRASLILMDAPPEFEKVDPFVRIARHLISLGLCAPAPLHVDTRHGFILLEDLGNNTFTRLLEQGADEESLYKFALDTLVHMQSHPVAKHIQLPDYSHQMLINESLLLCDWYYPRQTGKSINDDSRAAYTDIWRQILASLPDVQSTLVLRDFHVDNMIRLDDGRCGLLDFQDAVIGSPAYDLMSLLEDARRDMQSGLQALLLEKYFTAMHTVYEAELMPWYHVLGAQRHCKVLGIFSRLSMRDGKHHYLSHIDRVECLLKAKLDIPDLNPLKQWIEINLKLKKSRH